MGLSTHIFSLILLPYVRLRACTHTHTHTHKGLIMVLYREVMTLKGAM